MEKNKTFTAKSVSSRNRNKNKNINKQIKAHERIMAKREKLAKAFEISEIEDEKLEVKAAIDEKPLRDKVVVVPERKNIVDEDNDPNYISINIDRFRFVDDAEYGVDRFIDYDDVKEDSYEEIGLSDKDEFSVVETGRDEDVEPIDKEEYVVETVSNEEMIPRPTENVQVNAKNHFSFESRIVVLLTIIVVTFFIAGFFIFKSVTHSTNNSIVYDEKGGIDYEVCINDNSNQYYSEKCLDDDMEYVSKITERIPVTFDYEMSFNKSVSSKVSYYVVSKVNIYREKYGKILNTMEEVLVERTEADVFGDDAGFSVDVDLPFKKYRDYASNYNIKYGVGEYAEVEVVFYVDNGNVIKKASSMVLPLLSDTFTADVFEVENFKQNLTVANEGWSGINASYGAVGIIFVLFGVLGIIRLSNLVFKVMGTTSMYQRKLNKILREYDRYIVISRGDYDIDSSKRLVKTASFLELLDARNTLDKPIVYVKVNNVKCNFFVEDSGTIYKYTLKEADFEGK